MREDVTDKYYGKFYLQLYCLGYITTNVDKKVKIVYQTFCFQLLMKFTEPHTPLFPPFFVKFYDFLDLLICFIILFKNF